MWFFFFFFNSAWGSWVARGIPVPKRSTPRCNRHPQAYANRVWRQHAIRPSLCGRTTVLQPTALQPRQGGRGGRLRAGRWSQAEDSILHVFKMSAEGLLSMGILEGAPSSASHSHQNFSLPSHRTADVGSRPCLLSPKPFFFFFLSRSRSKALVFCLFVCF